MEEMATSSVPLGSVEDHRQPLDVCSWNLEDRLSGSRLQSIQLTLFQEKIGRWVFLPLLFVRIVITSAHVAIKNGPLIFYNPVGLMDTCPIGFHS